MKEFWDDRYRQEEYAYGVIPNEYFREKIMSLDLGRILLPGEGEGRNAVFAAEIGWEVTAFDMSSEAKIKAMQLAMHRGVFVNYCVGSLEELDLSSETFDVLALIYFHMPSEVRKSTFQKLIKLLKPGGIVILEMFSKNHLELNTQNPGVGGPKDLDSLYSIEEIQLDFNHFQIIELKQEKITLNEGIYHNGKASVVRFIGKKLLLEE
ncbi:MAG: class I SAM-dependent methyltransferase [Flavobacteriaceae bacterium]|nr:class I SAM-dependent methyltransferase [Flavobacteriaceae bacterium]